MHILGYLGVGLIVRVSNNSHKWKGDLSASVSRKIDYRHRVRMRAYKRARGRRR